MEERLTIETKDGQTFACKFTQGMGVPSFINVNPDGAWNGASTPIRGERNRRVVSAAGDTPDFILKDEAYADRFNFVGLIQDDVSKKRLFLFRDLKKRGIILVPDLFLEESIARTVNFVLECKYYIVSKFTDSSVVDSVEVQAVDVTEFGSDVSYSEMDIYTPTTGITGRRNVQLFMLGSDETVVGANNKLENKLIIPNTFQTVTQVDNAFRSCKNLVLALTF